MNNKLLEAIAEYSKYLNNEYEVVNPFELIQEDDFTLNKIELDEIELEQTELK